MSVVANTTRDYPFTYIANILKVFDDCKEMWNYFKTLYWELCQLRIYALQIACGAKFSSEIDLLIKFIISANFIWICSIFLLYLLC